MATHEQADLVDVTVGVVGRAHGIRGDLTIDVRTDEPERRFAPGTVLTAQLTPVAGGGQRLLTVDDARWHSGRLLVTFAEVTDRNQAEALRGAELSVRVPKDEQPADEGEYYDRQLIGMMAVTTEGVEIGRVTHVVHLAEQDLLAIDADGNERLVPFVQALVPAVDLTAGTLTVNAIPGLLDDEEDE